MGELIYGLKLLMMRFIYKSYVPCILISGFLLIHFFYIWVFGWLSKLDAQGASIASTLTGSAATLFTALAASFLIYVWKDQHHQAMLSRIALEAWDHNEKVISEIERLLWLSRKGDAKDLPLTIIQSKILDEAYLCKIKHRQLIAILAKHFYAEEINLIEDYDYAFSAVFYLGQLDHDELYEYLQDKDSVHHLKQVSYSAISVYEKFITPT